MEHAHCDEVGDDGEAGSDGEEEPVVSLWIAARQTKAAAGGAGSRGVRKCLLAVFLNQLGKRFSTRIFQNSAKGCVATVVRKKVLTVSLAQGTNASIAALSIYLAVFIPMSSIKTGLFHEPILATQVTVINQAKRLPAWLGSGLARYRHRLFKRCRLVSRSIRAPGFPVIALRSPDRIAETGLRACPPEKRPRRLAR
jgi:hypothetical protein